MHIINNIKSSIYSILSNIPTRNIIYLFHFSNIVYTLGMTHLAFNILKGRVHKIPPRLILACICYLAFRLVFRRYRKNLCDFLYQNPTAIMDQRMYDQIDLDLLSAVAKSPHINQWNVIHRPYSPAWRFPKESRLAMLRNPWAFFLLFDSIDTYDIERFKNSLDLIPSAKNRAIISCMLSPLELATLTEWQDDPDVVSVAVSYKPEMFQFASLRLKDDPDFVLQMCLSNGNGTIGDPPLGSDPNQISEALSNREKACGKALLFASKRLIDDDHFLDRVFNEVPFAIASAAKQRNRFRFDKILSYFAHPRMTITSLKHFPLLYLGPEPPFYIDFIDLIPDKLRQDIIRKNPSFFPFLRFNTQSRRVMLDALKANKAILPMIPQHYRSDHRFTFEALPLEDLPDDHPLKLRFLWIGLVVK